MKEIVFINKNIARWKEFESILSDKRKVKPDHLGELFIHITDDLSFSRTYYPTSEITTYLNSLALQSHQMIYKNKREKGSRIINFWATEFPLVMFRTRKYVLYSFAIFFVSVLIGCISVANDDTFVRLILGDAYVNMTIENIQKGDPMAVYKKMNQTDMFVGITINNIQVSFWAFVLGLFFSVGSGYMLFYNGLMLGAFQYFFFQKGLLVTSLLTIWIHGTLEIFSIIVAGAAGIAIGNSFLFPQTYSRAFSFRRGAKLGVKMVVGLVPMFIIAGFFEGFVTRQTDAPVFIRAGIIFASIVFIVWYFFILPARLNKLTYQIQ